MSKHWFEIIRIAAFSLAVLLGFSLGACQDGPAPLTAEVPLHLEDHLDAAVITGSQAPSDIPEPIEWRFDEPQPDWKPAKPVQDYIAPARISRTEDSLVLHLSEANDFKDRGRPNLIGAVYVDLADWSLNDWDDILAARGKSTTMHKVLGKENILVYNCFMAMGRRNQRQRQKGLWVAAADLPQTAAHPFYRRLNELLDEHGFDDFAEQRCEQFYAAHMGRPSLTPGSYFRCLLIGYLEGIDSERGIAWRLADSISLRRFLAIELDESTPDHSTISRTRRLIDVETHREVFTWVLQLLAKQGLLKGGTIAVDATTLEASAALRSIVRRDSGESYEEFLRGLAAESGIETPSREQLAKLDKKRKNKGSNKDWTNPHDPDAKIAKMKDGRTHLAHKAEHAVDLETGALLALTLQGADLGDTTTVSETISAAAQQVAAVAQDQEANEQLSPQGLQEVVADKGYHSNDVLTDLTALEMRSYINEPDRGRRNWCGKPRQQQAVYGNRRRMRGKRGKQLSRLRGERVERSFAHLYETGRMRRTHLRGHENILKRLLIHGGAFNLSLVLRKERGAGTPRGLAEAKKAFDWLLETVRRPFSAGRTLLLRLWPHPANTPFRLQSQSCVFGPARTA